MVSLGPRKKFMKVFGLRCMAEDFYLKAKEHIKESYPNEKFFETQKHNQNWMYSLENNSKENNEVFISLKKQEYVSSTLAMNEFEAFLKEED
jgi:hypothetical protein